MAYLQNIASSKIDSMFVGVFDGGLGKFLRLI